MLLYKTCNGLDVKSAIALSLFSIISASLSATIVYSKKELVNFKYGSLPEIFSVIGAIIGSNIAKLLALLSSNYSSFVLD